MLVIVVCCSIASFAQSDNEGKKKEIPKPKPPVVIVNLDKKSDKKNPKEKEDKKPESYIFGILKDLKID